MTTLNVSEARNGFAAALRDARQSPVTIQKHGRREAVLISPELFDSLTSAAEELEDIAAFDEAMAEEGPNIPWEDLKAELGWV